MTTKSLRTKSATMLVFLLSAVYMASYITRVNLAAIVSEVELASGISRSSLSFALTASFISYGAGQIVSGLLGDKLPPKLVVASGLSLTSLMNLTMPLCTSAASMTVAWCINGFAQSLMWPPVVKIMAAALSEDDFKRATTSVSMFGTVGSVCVYLLAPLIIALLGYKWVFIASAICGLTVLALWCIFAKGEYKNPDISEKKTTIGDKFNIFTPIAILLLLATTLQGALRDGVTTWTPTFISDTFKLGSEISILTGVVLPVFAVGSVYLTSLAYRRLSINPITFAGIIFAGAAVFALLLFLFGTGIIALSVIFSALLTASMHAINFLLIGMVPGLLAKYKNISFLSGIINSATYVGSALFTFGIAALSEGFGWELTIGIWVLIAALGAVICLTIARPFVKSIKTED